MKELSIEEKARRYDEVLKAAVVAHKDEDKHLKATLERIIPELKESGDERIRKTIYNCVKWFGFDSHFFKDVSQEECLSWLEAHGEQKHIQSEEEDRIIKEIISAINLYCTTYLRGDIRDKMLAWIEKQGEQKPQRMVSAEAKEALLEEKPAWSEEDEKKMDNLIQHLKIAYSDCEWIEKTIAWLKSFKYRVLLIEEL